MGDSPRRSVLLGTCAAAAVLLVAAPSPAAALRTLRVAAEPGDPYAPLVALLSLLAWALAGWLTLTAVATAAGHLPGAAGRVGAAVSRHVAPAAARGAIELALGLSVAVGTLGASPALAASPAGPPAAPPAPAGAPSLDWAALAADAPPLDWTAPPTEQPSPPVDADRTVVVQPGDTLWDLAEQDLMLRTGTAPTDAEVAQAWPSWWAANRDAVGDDPDLISPGTHLTPPEDTPTSS